MTGRVVTNLALLLVVVGAGWLVWPSTKPMPETTFNLTDGRILDSSDLRGKSVLVNFWSVSCEVCLRDMPRLARLHESLQGEGFMVIGVAAPHDPPPAVLSTVDRLAPGYPIALDVHGEISRAFGGIKVTPTNFLITPRGDISLVEQGPLDEIRIRATLLTFRG